MAKSKTDEELLEESGMSPGDALKALPQSEKARQLALIDMVGEMALTETEKLPSGEVTVVRRQPSWQLRAAKIEEAGQDRRSSIVRIPRKMLDAFSLLVKAVPSRADIPVLVQNDIIAGFVCALVTLPGEEAIALVTGIDSTKRATSRYREVLTIGTAGWRALQEHRGKAAADQRYPELDADDVAALLTILIEEALAVTAKGRKAGQVGKQIALALEIGLKELDRRSK